MKGRKGSYFKYNLPDAAALEQFLANLNLGNTKSLISGILRTEFLASKI